MSLIRSRLIFLVFSLTIAGALSAQTSWTAQYSGVADSLMNVKALNDMVVWGVGSGGCVVRTTDGGKVWDRCGTPLPHFVNVCVEPLNAMIAWVVSIDASGTDFRIFKTFDGGKKWGQAFRTANTFGDAVRFFDSEHGIALGDPYPAGYFNVYTTSDGGTSWHRVAPDMIPPADSVTGEFGVTACLRLIGKDAWFSTASQSGDFSPRVFRSTDRGKSWTASQPIKGLSGIAVSLDFSDRLHGVIVDNLGGRWAETGDGGTTWRVHDMRRLLWLRDIRIIPGSGALIVAGGEPDSGYVLVRRPGHSWKPVPLPPGTERIRSASFISKRIGWVVGGGGQILKWTGGDITRQ